MSPENPRWEFNLPDLTITAAAENARTLFNSGRSMPIAIHENLMDLANKLSLKTFSQVRKHNFSHYEALLAYMWSAAGLGSALAPYEDKNPIQFDPDTEELIEQHKGEDRIAYERYQMLLEEDPTGLTTIRTIFDETAEHYLIDEEPTKFEDFLAGIKNFSLSELQAKKREFPPRLQGALQFVLDYDRIARFIQIGEF